MGKSTINRYKWPFSIAICMFTRPATSTFAVSSCPMMATPWRHQGSRAVPCASPTAAAAESTPGRVEHSLWPYMGGINHPQMIVLSLSLPKYCNDMVSHRASNPTKKHILKVKSHCTSETLNTFKASCQSRAGFRTSG